MQKYLDYSRPVVIAILLIASVIFLYPAIQDIRTSSQALQANNTYKGHVLRVISDRAPDSPAPPRQTFVQELSVQFTVDGQKYVRDVENDLVRVEEGDEVFVQAASLTDPESVAYVIDAVRLDGLLWLVALFAVIVIVIARKQGLFALAGLLFSGVIIFSFVIPRIQGGQDPVWVGLTGASFILITTLYTSHGIDKKSIAAFLGIMTTLLFTALLADYAVSALHLTGFGAEESVYINASENKINLAGLLIAGIIIAAIGVMDDIAVTQASTVFQLAESNEQMDNKKLFAKAMVVGRDHISAVINTLVLAYAGAALPLLLVLQMNYFPLGFVLNSEIIVEEIVRTIVSSSGLVLAVPVTTALAVLLRKK